MKELEDLKKEHKRLHIYVILVVIILGGGIFLIAFQEETERKRADFYHDLFWETADICEQLAIDYNFILEGWDNLNQTQKDQMLFYLKVSAEKLSHG